MTNLHLCMWNKFTLKLDTAWGVSPWSLWHLPPHRLRLLIRKADLSVHTKHLEQHYASLWRKTWQNVEAGVQEVMAELCTVCDEWDRCDLGLSKCWQCWWQDRQDTKSGASCIHHSVGPLCCQPLTEGTFGSRVYLWWADDRYAIQPMLIGDSKCIMFFSLFFFFWPYVLCCFIDYLCWQCMH